MAQYESDFLTGFKYGVTDFLNVVARMWLLSYAMEHGAKNEVNRTTIDTRAETNCTQIEGIN
jgi:hypothetical protein